MKENHMPAKKKKSTEVTTITNNLVLPNDLAGELASLGALDGLDKDDRPLPYWIYNAKIKLDDGSWVSKDTFFNTVTEESKDEIDCVLLHLRKTRRHAEYIEGVGTQVHCRSEDLKTGITVDGEFCNCETCPSKKWGSGRGREAAPKCNTVYNLIGIDLEDQSPFMVRAKVTSLKPVQKFLARHFVGKLRLKSGAMHDLPLFVYKTKLSLQMPTDNYSVLSLDNISPCTEAEIREYQSLYEYFKTSDRVRTDVEPDETIEDSDGDSESDVSMSGNSAADDNDADFLND